MTASGKSFLEAMIPIRNGMGESGITARNQLPMSG